MARQPTYTLAARNRTLDLSEPRIMGIVNATPDSFSDGGARQDLAARLDYGAELLADGADLLDIGGESGVTNRPAVEPREELDRVVPLIERLVAQRDALISVDTYKPEVARGAIEAGAAMINDPSGLIDPEIAEICGATGAALVITHTLARPKQKLRDPHYDDIVDDVKGLLAERIEQACKLGVREDQILLCPGPDMGKNPAQTIELLRRVGELCTLGRPLLLSVSRKDFIGALSSRPPRRRLGGTLAAVAYGLDNGGHVLRLHDVSEARDFLTVRAALRGEIEVDADLALADHLRWEPSAQEAKAPSANETR